MTSPEKQVYEQKTGGGKQLWWKEEGLLLGLRQTQVQVLAESSNWVSVQQANE